MNVWNDRNGEGAAEAAPRLYHVIAGVLRENIVNERLPIGFVLLEGPIADLFQTSRAPVQRALQILESENLTHRFGGRGYLVGPRGAKVHPRRGNLRSLDLTLPEDADTLLYGRAGWERIYAAVETAVASCLIFGEFRIVEAEMAAHFNVSRTVVRDVLSRLHERGLIRKNLSSHWVAGPLTAQAIRERFQLRRLLEPPALISAAPHVERAQLVEMRRKLAEAESQYPQATADAVDAIEYELHTRCVLATPNEHLAEVIRHNQLPLLATQRLLRSLGVPGDPAVATELRLVIELLLQRADATAAAALDAHLDAACRRSIGRLKIVAVFPEPASLVPYLTRKVP